MIHVDTDHGSQGDATLAAIHNRLDLLETQVAELERALEARDAPLRRPVGGAEPIILPPQHAPKTSRPSTGIAPASQEASQPSAAWARPLVIGAGLAAAALMVIEVMA